MLPNNIEQKIVKHVHLTLGHFGVDKYSEEIKYVFHIKDIGRKQEIYSMLWRVPENQTS